MRILFITQWFDPEPGAIRGLPLAKWLKNRGHEVTVLTGFPNYPTGKVYAGYKIRMWQKETIDGVEILRVPLFPSHSGSAIGRVANFLSFAAAAATLGFAKTKAHDVVYVYHPPATVGIAGLAQKWLRGTPFVYHIADMWPESVVESGMVGRGVMRDVIGGVLDRFCRIFYRSAAAITVLSPGFKELLTQRGVPAEKVRVIYNWTDDEVFVPTPPDESLRTEFALRGRFVVLYAGNLGAFQGLETVIRAAALLRDEPKIHFAFAGAGQCEAQMRALAAEFQLANVSFIPSRPFRSMPQVNALADVLLVHLKDLPFFTSTIPSKTQVSLASGKPILMAVRGDAAKVILEARAGLAAEPGNEVAIAEAVLKLYRMKPSERDEMGERGRDFYLKNMSLEVGGKAMEELFAQVMRTGAIHETSGAQDVSC